MPGTPEFSESGAPIFRNQHREREFEPAIGDSETLDKVTKHIQTHIGEPANVFHEIISDIVHIDVHIVNPVPDRNFYTLVTSGMSDRPMSVPAGEDDHRFVELLICLPPSWRLSQTELRDEATYWPIRWLKTLARLPHTNQTWLWYAHTVPNGDPPEPYAKNTKLCCALVSIPVLFGQGVHQLFVSPQKTIHLLSFVPLYREEMDFKLKHGSDALFERLDGAKVTELLDIKRTNVCKKRFGLF